MPLIERLMGLNANGSESPNGSPDRPKIPIHTFFAVCNEMDQNGIGGISGLTVAAVKTAFSMDASEQTELDALIALRPTGTTTANLIARARYISRIHSVLTTADGRHRYPLPGYTTPAEIRTKLNLPTP
jgi:hypothetical protein